MATQTTSAVTNARSGRSWKSLNAQSVETIIATAAMHKTVITITAIIPAPANRIVADH
jgi:hypothetical protein